MRRLTSLSIRGLSVASFSIFLLLSLLVIPASAAGWHHGRVFIAPYAGWDDWGWGGGPYWNDYYYRVPTGKVKLEHVAADDQVYLNGSFAGRAEDLGTMRLLPGRYNLEIKDKGKDVLKESIFVTSDHTLKLNVGDKVHQS